MAREVLRSLKATEATRDIPVVVTTVIDDKQMGYALGAADYLVKPIDRQALLARLDRFQLTATAAEREVRVLAVDDDPVALDLLDHILSPLGFHVLRAAGGQEAIALARSDSPHVILLDLMMPTVSGFDVVATLKDDPLTRVIPIVIVTAKDMTEQEKQQLSGQVSAILQKGSALRVELLTWLDQLRQRVQTEPDISRV